ncbi:MAG: ComEC/Rec2 family competence protein [Bacteroidota bacterium]
MINFKSIPFFKILFPYLLGIICFDYISEFKGLHLIFFSASLLWLITFFVQKFHEPNSSFKKVAYILCTNLLLFSSAYESCHLYNARNKLDHYSNFVSPKPQKFIAIINDIPVITQKFIKIPVEVMAIEQNNNWHYAEGNTILYFKNDSLQTFRLGNRILINTQFSFVNDPKNPFEFDYKEFLQNKNIFHVVYANAEKVKLISETNPRFSISQIGTRIKAHLVSVLRNSSLSQEAFSICSALLVGYDDEIDSAVMQSFSHSGTLHILSVSGMHTGVLYGILIFVFSLFDKHDRYKKTKFCFVMLFLLLFVFITGLSPSVLRAALMLSLVLFGKTFYKQGNAYNTLLLSAFLLLLFNPYLIKDVGFLLSYFAVFGIMYLYPVLHKIHIFENRILQWLWTSVLISVAATVFTLPISLYYFHQFPIWFAFSNLIIIPISMLIMIAAALFLIVYKIVFLNYVVVYIINISTSAMLWLAQLTDNSRYGFIDFISFSVTDLVFLSLAIALCLMIISGKQYKQVLALCFLMIAWLSASIYNNYKQLDEKELIIFHVKQRSVFALRVGQTVYGNFNELPEKELQRHVKPYLLTISNLKIVPIKSNALKVNGREIVNAHRSGVLQPNSDPQYIIVSNDTPLELITNYKTRPVIIADCSNSSKFVKKLKRQCALAAISFYWAKETGAVQIKL